MKRWLISLIIVTALLGINGCQAAPAASQVLPRNNPSHPSMVSRDHLIQILNTEPKEKTLLKGRVISGVLPHHLLAGSLLTRYLSALAEQQPQLIILIGPNHKNQGSPIITSLNDWQTPEGRMLTDETMINSLIKRGLAVKDENVMEQEHSIAGLIPLLHHYLPDARVVPIILHHEVSLTDVDLLLDGLQPFMNQKTVILASVDFSHYLTRPQAQTKDQFTLNLMQKFDYTTLFQLDSDYLDSPAALACAFRYAEQKGIKSFQVIDNSNSGIIMGNDNIETTSYFTLVFSQ